MCLCLKTICICVSMAICELCPSGLGWLDKGGVYFVFHSCLPVALAAV